MLSIGNQLTGNIFCVVSESIEFLVLQHHSIAASHGDVIVLSLEPLFCLN